MGELTRKLPGEYPIELTDGSRIVSSSAAEIAMPKPDEQKHRPAPSQKMDAPPPPFADEVENVDRARSGAVNAAIEHEEAGSVDKTTRLVDRVHRLAR
jgi:hypothetical protein